MMKINGSCHCGEVTFEARIDPMKVRICHCIDCQKLSGTAFRTTVMSQPDGITFTKGKAKEYIKIAENGNRRAQGFCQDCGSSLYATTAEKSNRVYGIRVGTLEQRNELTPCFQFWCRSALPWLNKLNDIPAFEEN
ncbi:MAG: GFA family protein [Sinobacterium sp.]|jgi:hypothetical protein|uniref:GFA family protein n=1 Tax=uncultured Paraglaciecola sp. TaxID=1765024 RepID=UPI00345AE42E